MMENIDKIVDQAVKAYVQCLHLQCEADKVDLDCNGNVEAKRFDTRMDEARARSEARAYSMATHFNSLADYDRAIQDIQSTLNDPDNATGAGIETVANAQNAQDMDDGFADIVPRFNLVAVQSDLKRIACAHAILSFRWEKLQSDYYVCDRVPIDEIRPGGGVVGDHIAAIVEIMRDDKSLEEWKSLADCTIGAEQGPVLRKFTNAYKIS